MKEPGNSEPPQPEREQPSPPRASRLRRILVPAGTVALVIVISIVLYRFRHQIEDLKNYAYLGVFVVSLLSSATVIVPVPGVVVFVPLLATLNPVIVGVVGAVGSIFGETTGYAAGFSGRDLASRGRNYQRVEGWMKKRGSLIIFLFAVLPVLPFDVAGIVAGALRFPLWKFMLVAGAGKVIKYVALMLVAAWGAQWIMPWINKFLG
jgi:membrane protein YqaA with SNARE-associated domain